MDNVKVKVNEKLLKEVSEKYDGAEDFIKNRTEN